MKWRALRRTFWSRGGRTTLGSKGPIVCMRRWRKPDFIDFLRCYGENASSNSKKVDINMKNLFLLGIILLAVSAFAQVPYNSAVPNGYTKKAVVAEQVGLTQVTITYHRPAVKGREGKVWGVLVHKGFI